MKQPTLTIIKNFETDGDTEMHDVEYSPKKFSSDQKLSWRLKTKIYEELAKNNLNDWEKWILHLLKINHDEVKF